MMDDDTFPLDPDVTHELVCPTCGEEVGPSEHVLALFGDSSQRVMHRSCLEEFVADHDPHVRLVEVMPRVVEVL